MQKSGLHFFSKIRFGACLFALLGFSSRLLSVSIGIDIRFAHYRRLVPPVRWLLVICVCFPSISHASSPPVKDVHFCEVLDYKDILARDSLYAATKEALNLDVGEPRTVRMIYFLPNDRPFQQAEVDSMKVAMRWIQTFFADQMEAHGYGRKTFRIENDAQGEPVVHRVDGQHSNSHYLDHTSRNVSDEVSQVFDYSMNVYLILVDNGGLIGTVLGTGGGDRNSGIAFVSGPARGLMAHELGHAFGLQHDFRGAYVMSYGGSLSLSACHAEFLAVHPYFNPDVPDERTPRPTIELISPPGYSASSTSVPVQLKVKDSDGLHQVTLFVRTRSPHLAAGFLEVKACRGLNGERDAILQFDYDGDVPSDDQTNRWESRPTSHLC